MVVKDGKLRLVSYIAAAIGLADSIYLSWVKLAHRPIYCGGYGGCETVAESKYAAVAGIPVAFFGILAYLAILAFLYLEARDGFWADNGPLLVFGISLAGFFYSLYLTYLELYVIHAVCFYCVVSAVAITALLVLSIVRLARGQPGIESI